MPVTPFLKDGQCLQLPFSRDQALSRQKNERLGDPMKLKSARKIGFPVQLFRTVLASERREN